MQPLLISGWLAAVTISCQLFRGLHKNYMRQDDKVDQGILLVQIAQFAAGAGIAFFSDPALDGFDIFNFEKRADLYDRQRSMIDRHRADDHFGFDLAFRDPVKGINDLGDVEVGKFKFKARSEQRTFGAHAIVDNDRCQARILFCSQPFKRREQVHGDVIDLFSRDREGELLFQAEKRCSRLRGRPGHIFPAVS